MALKHLAGLILLAIPALATANPETFSTSPLLKGTRIVAGPNKDEFFILAQNDPVPSAKSMVEQKTMSSEPPNKMVPSKVVQNAAPANKMFVKLAKQSTKQNTKQHAKKTTPPHWVPKLKKALVDLKVPSRSPAISSKIVLKQQKKKKPVLAHKKKPVRTAKLDQKKSAVKLSQKTQMKKRTQFITFHVATFTPESSAAQKKPAPSLAQKPVVKAIPLRDEHEQIVAFNAD